MSAFLSYICSFVFDCEALCDICSWEVLFFCSTANKRNIFIITKIFLILQKSSTYFFKHLSSLQFILFIYFGETLHHTREGDPDKNKDVRRNSSQWRTSTRTCDDAEICDTDTDLILSVFHKKQNHFHSNQGVMSRRTLTKQNDLTEYDLYILMA